MTITTPEYIEDFIKFRFIYDNYLREEILTFKKTLKPPIL